MPPHRQTNIRLDDPTFEWLETVAFIHRRSVADELRAAVDDWMEKHSEDPRVRAAKELRDPDQRQEAQGEVSSLADRRKRPSRGNG